jgi:hypothetical protein
MKKLFLVCLTTGAFLTLSLALVPKDASADPPVTVNPCVNGKVTVGLFSNNNGTITTINIAYAYYNSTAEANAAIGAYNSNNPPNQNPFLYLAVTCNSTGIIH